MTLSIGQSTSRPGDFHEVCLGALQAVGPALFVSLLVTAVAILPVILFMIALLHYTSPGSAGKWLTAVSFATVGIGHWPDAGAAPRDNRVAEAPQPRWSVAVQARDARGFPGVRRFAELSGPSAAAAAQPRGKSIIRAAAQPRGKSIIRAATQSCRCGPTPRAARWSPIRGWVIGRAIPHIEAAGW